MKNIFIRMKLFISVSALIVVQVSSNSAITSLQTINLCIKRGGHMGGNLDCYGQCWIKTWALWAAAHAPPSVEALKTLS